MTPSDSTLNQILATLTSLGERLAVVEADLKTVIRDHTKDLDDHETRLRVLETTARDAITQDDLDARDAVRDRKQGNRLVLATAVIATVSILANIASAYIAAAH